MIRAAGLGLALLAGLSGSEAPAMTNNDALLGCSVDHAEKLPHGVSAESICELIRRAAMPALAQSGHASSDLSVRVIVDGPSKLTAAAVLRGQALPDHHVATSDRPLNARAVAMLARAIANDIASPRK